MPFPSRTVIVVTAGVMLGVLAGYQWGRFAATQKERKIQERLATRLKVNEQKLEQSLLATKNALLKLSPQRPFAKNLAGYSEEERAAIRRHAEAAISALPANASRFEQVAAVTAYVHQILQPRPEEDGKGTDVLSKGGSNCGGFRHLCRRAAGRHWRGCGFCLPAWRQPRRPHDAAGVFG
jgi:hypothetical protein